MLLQVPLMMENPTSNSKCCRRCRVVLPTQQFSRNISRRDGYQCWCKNCVRQTARQSILARMLKGSRHRAIKLNLSYDLTADYLSELNRNQKGLCAISGLPLNWKELPRQPQAQRTCPPDRASLDRLDPGKGYVCGNVQLVTELANRIKSDFSMAELTKWCEAVVIHQRSL